MSAMGARLELLLGVGELRASDGWIQADPIVLVMIADWDLINLESVANANSLSGVNDGG